MEQIEEKLATNELREVRDLGLVTTPPNTSVRGELKAVLICGNEYLRHEPVANKCCSSVKWVPNEVLEKGYGHRFGL